MRLVCWDTPERQYNLQCRRSALRLMWRWTHRRWAVSMPCQSNSDTASRVGRVVVVSSRSVVDCCCYGRNRRQILSNIAYCAPRHHLFVLISGLLCGVCQIKQETIRKEIIFKQRCRERWVVGIASSDSGSACATSATVLWIAYTELVCRMQNNSVRNSRAKWRPTSGVVYDPQYSVWILFAISKWGRTEGVAGITFAYM